MRLLTLAKSSVFSRESLGAYALLRPIADVSAHDRVRDLVLEAYTQFERETVASATIQGPT